MDIPRQQSLWSLIFFIVFSQVLLSQVYTFDKKTDILLGSSIVALGGLDYSLRQSTAALSALELSRLDRHQVLAIDRFAITLSSAQAANWSDYLHYSAMAFPLLLTTTRLDKQETGIIGLMLLETIGLNATLTFASKYIVKRPRPFMYDPEVSLSDKQSSSARLSFVSGHTSSAASLSFFTAKVFADLYPQSKWKGVVWTVGAVLPAVVGGLRVAGGRHFLTDVVAGYVLGGLVGWGIPMLHKRDSNIGLALGLNGGIGLTYTLR